MQRYNFQFTGQRFFVIEHGRLAGQVRDVAYQAHDDRLLGVDGGGRRPVDLPARRGVQLRQGPARPGGAGQPRLPVGPRPRCPRPQHPRGVGPMSGARRRPRTSSSRCSPPRPPRRRTTASSSSRRSTRPRSASPTTRRRPTASGCDRRVTVIRFVDVDGGPSRGASRPGWPAGPATSTSRTLVAAADGDARGGGDRPTTPAPLVRGSADADFDEPPALDRPRRARRRARRPGRCASTEPGRPGACSPASPSTAWRRRYLGTSTGLRRRHVSSRPARSSWSAGPTTAAGRRGPGPARADFADVDAGRPRRAPRPSGSTWAGRRVDLPGRALRGRSCRPTPSPT